jgi:alkyl hydroperoxide reductase subunit AhpC
MHGDYYRNHAARVRELASETTTPSIKDHLHDVARQYDLLAEKADEAGRRRARSGPP